MSEHLAVMESSAPHFEQTPEGVVLAGSFPLCIQVTGSLLDSLARGRIVDGAVSVTGHVEVSENRFLTHSVWDSITFRCVNGEATYDFVGQDAYDLLRDVWRGVRRAAVDAVMASLTDG